MQFLVAIFFAAFCTLTLGSSSSSKKGGYNPKKYPIEVKGTEHLSSQGRKPWPHFDDILKKKPQSATLSSYKDENTGKIGGLHLTVDYAGKAQKGKK